MVHILSQPRREEFLSADCIARFEMCITGTGSIPTLYIKSNIIDLYFIYKNRNTSLEILDGDTDEIIYIIGSAEGEETPFYLYSQVEIISEKIALLNVISGADFEIILFNDYAIEIARATAKYTGPKEAAAFLHEFVPKGPDFKAEKLAALTDAVNKFVEHPEHRFIPNIQVTEFISDASSIVYSGIDNVMRVSGFSGATEVHEMLPQIVSDHTFLDFVHSPDVEISPGNRREFSDAMILGEDAALSMQAKGFDFDGDVPPTSRSNAEKRTRKNLKKAIAQTRGSARMIREGKGIFSGEDNIQLSPTGLFIFCIFVPSLSLLSADANSELQELGNHLAEHNQFLVVLDPMQFLRTVQASVAASGQTGAIPDEAFFDLLIKNSEDALESGEYIRPIIYRW